VAWTVFGLSTAAVVAGVGVLALVPTQALVAAGTSFTLSTFYCVVVLAFGVVGAVVAARVGNAIGWLFLVMLAVQGAYQLGFALTHYSLAVNRLPWEPFTAWMSEQSPATPVLIGFAFLLFPDGRLPSRRWRPAAVAVVLAGAAMVARYALAPGPFTQFPGITNPLGVETMPWLRQVPTDHLPAAVLVPGVVALVVRFRRSRGPERLQLKWFAWAGGLVVAVNGVVLAIDAVVPAPVDLDAVGGAVFALVLCTVPAAIGIAISRYRLYDVDLVINRTLVYLALTAVLGASYVGGVLVLQQVLSPLTETSDLAVAGSTLAVAALFRPVRGRVQTVVDRRFYRRRYDATRTLEAFGGRLRELDLDTLGADLQGVVRETVEPTAVRLWLRDGST
jgi:hypothetical protein